MIEAIANDSTARATLTITPTAMAAPDAADPAEPTPNGTSTAMSKGATNEIAVEMIVPANWVMRNRRTRTPNVDQKRWRVRIHDRAIARIGPAPSSTIAEGAR